MGLRVAMRRGAVGFGLVVLGLLHIACSHAGMTYRHTMRAWTRHRTVYSLEDLRAELQWSATLLSAPFRDARIAYEAVLRGGTWADVEQSLPYEWLLPGTAFLVGLYAPKGVERLGTSFNDGYWQLAMTAPDGTVTHPVSVVEVPVTPLEQKLFPHLTRWSRAFLVRFPSDLSPGPLRLNINGVRARSELSWTVR